LSSNLAVFRSNFSNEFCITKKSKFSQNKNALFNEQTASLCRVIVSLVFTGILWVSLHGWQYGLLALFTTAIANFSLLFFTKNRLSQVVAGTTLLIGGRFLVTTIKMVALSI
jgi:hypothetical protein